LKNVKIMILPKDRKTVYPVSPRVVPTDWASGASEYRVGLRLRPVFLAPSAHSLLRCEFTPDASMPRKPNQVLVTGSLEILKLGFISEGAHTNTRG
jgi:hypothetical protein